VNTSPTRKTRTIRSITAPRPQSPIRTRSEYLLANMRHVLHHKAEGPALIIDNPSSCRFADTGVECSTWHVELSCTQHDGLALKPLLIPIHSRSSTPGLYRRASAEAKPDDLR